MLVGLLLLAVGAILTPVVAQATSSPPHWKISGTVRNIEHVPVTTYGNNEKITFAINPSGVKLACRVKFTDSVSNPSPTTEGVDEMTAFAVTKCSQPASRMCAKNSAVEVQALGLPWVSHLNSAPPPGGAEGENVLEGVQLDFRCAGIQSAGTFSGSLSALIHLVRNKPHCGGLNPAACGDFEYTGQASLTGESGTVGVTGIDRVSVEHTHKGDVQVCYCNQQG
jgi:hypothetical protein